MTKAKKTLSVLLAVLMVLGTCLFSAFAVAPAENTYTATLTVSPNVQTAKAGDTVTFTVALTTDYAASTASAIVAYDTNVFEAPAVTPSETLFGAFPATEGAAYVNLPANQAGAFVVDKSNNKTGKLQDATLFTVALKVKAGATAGPTTVSVVEDKKAENHEGSLYCGRYDAATNKVVTYGQTFNLNNSTISIEGGAVAPATLTTKLTGVIDEASIPGTALLYGMPAGANPADYFGLSDGSTVAFEANAAGATNGTGATVTVGEKVYTLVVFGDLDGTGTVDGNDAMAIKQFVADSSVHALTEVQLIAGDLDNTNTVDGNDAMAIMQYVADSVVHPVKNTK